MDVGIGVGSFMDMLLHLDGLGSTSLPSQLVSPLHSSLLERFGTLGGVGDVVSVDDMMVQCADDTPAPETQVHINFFFLFS